MKRIDIDDELYRYIASHTQHIGESASDILRRMLGFADSTIPVENMENVENIVDVDLQPLLQSEAFLNEKKTVNRFMMLLSCLYRLDPTRFAEATESLRGRTRVYFAYDKQTLLQSGIHTKPKMIPNSSYWVITNTNSARKRMMIKQIMSTMQLPKELIDQACSHIS